jgi:hypothetical protein
MVVTVNQDLADRAMQIAKAQRIDFGEALYQARREMADIVQQNTGSPLRDQQDSSAPDPAKIKEAVMAGLTAVPIWNLGKLTTYAISQGCEEVGNHLAALGLGPQIISALKTELSNWLNYNGNNSTPSAVTWAAGDHVQKVYTDALANKVATQVWADGIVRPVQGVALAERAEKLSRQRNISFGEALNIARREITMGADASLTSDQIEHAIAGDVTNAVNSAFNGKPKIIFESMDALKIIEAVKAAITRLDIGSLGVGPIKAAEATVNTFIGASVNAPDKIAAKVIAAIQKAYDAESSGT